MFEACLIYSSQTTISKQSSGFLVITIFITLIFSLKINCEVKIAQTIMVSNSVCGIMETQGNGETHFHSVFQRDFEK